MMHSALCPECEAAHVALLDQIVEHKVELEDLKEAVAEMQAVLDFMLAEDEEFESEDDEEDVEDDEDE